MLLRMVAQHVPAKQRVAAGSVVGWVEAKPSEECCAA
jgi:hypothetical protein